MLFAASQWDDGASEEWSRFRGSPSFLTYVFRSTSFSSFVLSFRDVSHVFLLVPAPRATSGRARDLSPVRPSCGAMRPAPDAAVDCDSPGAKRTRVDWPKNVKGPCISVLMPCRDAMPWLPDCVSSVLAQVGLEGDGGLELIVVDDGSVDGSLEWLLRCAEALEERTHAGLGNQTTEAPSCTTHVKFASKSVGHAFPADRLAWEPDKLTALTVTQVVANARPENKLKVLTVHAFGPSGQGLALNRAFQNATAALIGEMESDDLRPPDCFFQLKNALRTHDTWDGVTSSVKLIGWDRPGMSRWMEWQNSLATPELMRKGRFLEIPAMRGAGLYRRLAMEKMATTRDDQGGGAQNPYRDLWEVSGRVQDCAHLEDPDYKSKNRIAERPNGWWPVDADFWQRWFAENLTAGKLNKPLYFWRQYPAQSTRTHDRCGLHRLRKCKAYFLVKPGGPCYGKAVQVWGTGDTLAAWTLDLRDALVTRLKSTLKIGTEISNELESAIRNSIQPIEYKPGAPVSWAMLRAEDAKSINAVLALSQRLPETAENHGYDREKCDVPIRLFSFGMEKARQKVKSTFRGGFDEQSDQFWFVA
jgi:glycosyltransferase involved in cell wall biosynthesis